MSAAPSAVPGAHCTPKTPVAPGRSAQLTVLLAAAGLGTRLGAGVPKALAPLAEEPLLVHALRSVRAAVPEAAVVILHPPGDRRLHAAVEEAFGSELLGRIAWVAGGQERADSVRAGLEAVRTPRVLVHDCARALTPPSVFAAVLDALDDGASGAIPAVPLVDTVKLLAEDGEHIESTPPRSRLRAVQTPQGFLTADLRQAHDAVASGRIPSAAATDDSMLLEALGREVRLVPGHEEALKVTTPIDLVLAEHYLARRTSPQETS